METLLNEQLLLEDLLDDIADAQQKKVDLTKLANQDDDDDDAYADDRQEERPVSIDYWDYVVEIMTIDVTHLKPEKMEEYYNGIMSRFFDFFSLYHKLKAHSPLEFYRGLKEFHLPEELEELRTTLNQFYSACNSSYLSIKFGIDITFNNVKSLFRFFSHMYRASWGAGWYLKFYSKDIPKHYVQGVGECDYYYVDRMTALNLMMTHNKKFWEFMKNDGDNLFRKFIKTAYEFLGQKQGIAEYFKQMMNYDQSDMYISGLLREYLTDGRSRKVTLTKMMEQRITSNPIDADFVRTNDYPGFYFSSPTSMRVNEMAYTYDIKCPYVTGEFADQVTERQIYVKDYTLRMAGRGFIMFAAYIGTFYKSDGPLEGTDNQENDCVVWFNGYIEKHMFWDALAGLFGTHFDDADIERVVWKTFKMHYEPQK